MSIFKPDDIVKKIQLLESNVGLLFQERELKNRPSFSSMNDKKCPGCGSTNKKPNYDYSDLLYWHCTDCNFNLGKSKLWSQE